MTPTVLINMFSEERFLVSKLYTFFGTPGVIFTGLCPHILISAASPLITQYYFPGLVYCNQGLAIEC